MLSGLSDYTPIVSDIFAIFTILMQVIIVLVIVSLFVEKKTPGKLRPFLDFFRNNSMLLAFLVALGATVGSLFYSEIAEYTPCLFCWYQRIFIYPQVVLLGMAIWKKDQGIRIYSIGIAVVAALLSAYHYYLQVFNVDAGCSAVGYSAACSSHFVLNYGYITIPMMALSTSLFIILMMKLKPSDTTTE